MFTAATFIFDSSHHLNCHSNFLPKIAPFGRAIRTTGTSTVLGRTIGCTGRADRNGEQNDKRGNCCGGHRASERGRLLRPWHGLFFGGRRADRSGASPQMVQYRCHARPQRCGAAASRDCRADERFRDRLCATRRAGLAQSPSAGACRGDRHPRCSLIASTVGCVHARNASRTLAMTFGQSPGVR